MNDLYSDWDQYENFQDSAPINWSPQILDRICSFLPSSKDKLQFSLVHSNWQSVGLEVLWRYPSFPSEFSLQNFLHKIRLRRSKMYNVKGLFLSHSIEESFDNSSNQIVQTLLGENHILNSYIDNPLSKSIHSDPQILSMLVRTSKNLKKLSIYGYNLKNVNVVDLYHLNNSLEDLEIIGAPIDHIISFPTLIRGLKHLKSLKLRFNISIQPEILKAISVHAHRLEILEIWANDCDVDLQSVLLKTGNLKVLHIVGDNNNIEDYILKSVAYNNHNLQSVVIEASGLMSSSVIALLESCTDLVRIEIITNKTPVINLENSSVVLTAKNLTKFLLSGVSLSANIFNQIFIYNNNLQTVSISGSDEVSSENIINLSQNALCLEGLLLNECPNVDGSFIKYLSLYQYENLSALQISDCSIQNSPDLHVFLQRFTNIQSLGISGYEIVRKSFRISLSDDNTNNLIVHTSTQNITADPNVPTDDPDTQDIPMSIDTPQKRLDFSEISSILYSDVRVPDVNSNISMNHGTQDSEIHQDHYEQEKDFKKSLHEGHSKTEIELQDSQNQYQSLDNDQNLLFQEERLKTNLASSQTDLEDKRNHEHNSDTDKNLDEYEHLFEDDAEKLEETNKINDLQNIYDSGIEEKMESPKNNFQDFTQLDGDEHNQSINSRKDQDNNSNVLDNNIDENNVDEDDDTWIVYPQQEISMNEVEIDVWKNEVDFFKPIAYENVGNTIVHPQTDTVEPVSPRTAELYVDGPAIIVGGLGSVKPNKDTLLSKLDEDLQANTSVSKSGIELENQITSPEDHPGFSNNPFFKKSSFKKDSPALSKDSNNANSNILANLQNITSPHIQATTNINYKEQNLSKNSKHKSIASGSSDIDDDSDDSELNSKSYADNKETLVTLKSPNTDITTTGDLNKFGTKNNDSSFNAAYIDIDINNKTPTSNSSDGSNIDSAFDLKGREYSSAYTDAEKNKFFNEQFLNKPARKMYKTNSSSGSSKTQGRYKDDDDHITQSNIATNAENDIENNSNNEISQNANNQTDTYDSANHNDEGVKYNISNTMERSHSEVNKPITSSSPKKARYENQNIFLLNDYDEHEANRPLMDIYSSINQKILKRDQEKKTNIDIEMKDESVVNNTLEKSNDMDIEEGDLNLDGEGEETNDWDDYPISMRPGISYNLSNKESINFGDFKFDQQEQELPKYLRRLSAISTVGVKERSNNPELYSLPNTQKGAFFDIDLKSPSEGLQKSSISTLESRRHMFLPESNTPQKRNIGEGKNSSRSTSEKVRPSVSRNTDQILVRGKTSGNKAITPSKLFPGKKKGTHSVLLELGVETPIHGRQTLRIFEGDDPIKVSEVFCAEHGMPELASGLRTLLINKLERKLRKSGGKVPHT
ncbi:hypothetical protein BB559_006014 [Furculomyces boomerangus]|uniref:Uncharacterized protein n=1 Tax=Furculomyces boomerangus TaxID=61424 RepID=A0A2T9Y5A2_9FUNG|nr:hypothetical protein BB559_006654 [Furculomyces boomerangus]PVU87498.1 hypothetical protein BB559_006014 [Furculomyces boomerangus]